MAGGVRDGAKSSSGVGPEGGVIRPNRAREGVWRGAGCGQIELVRGFIDQV